MSTVVARHAQSLAQNKGPITLINTLLKHETKAFDNTATTGTTRHNNSETIINNIHRH